MRRANPARRDVRVLGEGRRPEQPTAFITGRWSGAYADSSYRLDLTVGATTTSGFRTVTGTGLVVAAADSVSVRVERLYDPDTKNAYLALHNICNPPARVTAAHTGDELHSF